jgi:hypothetical protein
MPHLSPHDIRKEEIEMETEEMTVVKDLAAKSLADYAAAIKPTVKPVENDFLNKPTTGGHRWNGPRNVLPAPGAARRLKN